MPHAVFPTPDALPDLVRRAAYQHGDALAVVGADSNLTYADLDARADEMAAALANTGVRPGTRVALRLPPGPDYVALLWACLRAGAVVCPLSPRLPTERLRDTLERSNSTHLVTDLDDATPTGRTVRTLTVDDLRDRRSAVEALQRSDEIATDQPATLLSTSGSTGTPRLALHSYGNHYYSAHGSAFNLAVAPGDRWLLTLPLNHVGGLAILFRCALAGATVVVAGPSLDDDVAAQHVTHLSLVPTQLQRLLSGSGAGALSSVKAVLLGGGPIPDDLVAAALAADVPLHTTYGLTEMSSQVTTTPPGASADQLRTAGRVLPHRQLALGTDGELLVRGRTLFLGYVEDDEVQLPVDEYGWFHTNDLGALTPDGFLHVRGRADNLFITGGENVQPEEIEEALVQLAGVREAVVVAVPDDEYGARPIAFVRAEGDVRTEAPAWRSALERMLPRFKIPDAFHAWPNGAGTEGLKPDRAALQQLAVELQRGQQ